MASCCFFIYMNIKNLFDKILIKKFLKMNTYDIKETTKKIMNTIKIF